MSLHTLCCVISIWNFTKVNRFLENHIVHEAKIFRCLVRPYVAESSSVRPSQCQAELSWPPHDVDQAEIPTGSRFLKKDGFVVM